MARILILALVAGALRVASGGYARVAVDTDALPADKAFVGEMLTTRIAERTALSDKGTALTVRYELSPSLTGDRATVSVTGNVAVVRAGRFRGLVAGTGELLRSIRYGATSFSLASGERTFDPKCPMRLAYWARHFHNWYHMASADELKRYAEDLALWGVNAFDFQYCYPEVNLDHATPDEIAAFERTSRQLVEHLARLDCDFETFGGGNQIPDDWPDTLRGVSPKRGEWGGGCPSKPEALSRMVDLRRQALATLKGIDVAYMRHWPYDEGGCACAACRPWGGNGYPKICRLMNEMNRKAFPGVKTVVSTWQFDDEDWRTFNAYLATNDVSWIDCLLITDFDLHVPNHPFNHPVAKPIPIVTFPEISMWGRLPWGGFGAIAMPKRIEGFFRHSEKITSGFQYYSEGLSEDINKAVVARLHVDPSVKVEDVLRDYCRYEYPGTDPEDFVRLVTLMEKTQPMNEWQKAADRAAWQGVFDEMLELVRRMDAQILPRMRRAWRWRLVYLRSVIDHELFAAHGEKSEALRAAYGEIIDLCHAERHAGDFHDKYHRYVRPPL